MKILRLLLIILVPAMGIVGCAKSDVKPCNKSHETESPVYTAPESTSLSTDQPVLTGGGGSSTDIYGTGDDDREGGDKKSKKR